MFKTFKSTLLIMIVFLSTIFPVSAKTLSLQEIIDTYCSKNCVSAQQLTEVATRAAHTYKIDVRAILAIIHVESKYHIKAKNGSSVGLSQVLLRYHKPKFIGKDYYNVEDNIFAGMQVFHDCMRRMKQNYDKSFGCYNGGGDKKYKIKAMKAYRMMKNAKLPEVSKDPLGDFIQKKLL